MPRPAPSALAQPANHGRRGQHLLVTLFAMLLLVPIVSPSTSIVLFVGLLPTIVALIVDRTPRKCAVASVGGLNLAGVSPFLLDLWFKSPGMDYAVSLITNPFVLVTMYGAAAVGWLLFAGLPMLTLRISEITVGRRIRGLRDRQAALLAEWGEDVVGIAAERGADAADGGVGAGADGRADRGLAAQ
jgi:hypothetical protein